MIGHVNYRKIIKNSCVIGLCLILFFHAIHTHACKKQYAYYHSKDLKLNSCVLWQALFIQIFFKKLMVDYIYSIVDGPEWKKRNKHHTKIEKKERKRVTSYVDKDIRKTIQILSDRYSILAIC